MTLIIEGEVKKRCLGITANETQCKWNALPGSNHCSYHNPTGLRNTKPGGQPQCRATVRKTGKQCRRSATLNYGVCQVHGSGAPFKGRPGGRPKKDGSKFSKFLPDYLSERLQSALKNAELLNLGEDIAMIDVMETRLMERLPQEGVVTAALDVVAKGIAALKKARDKEDQLAMFAAVDIIIGSTDVLVSEDYHLKEILKIKEAKSRIQAKEVARRKAMNAFLKPEEGLALGEAMVKIVMKHVPEQERRDAIAKELAGLFST